MMHFKKPFQIRKLILLLSVLIVLIPVLAGCQSAQTAPETTLSQESTQESTQESSHESSYEPLSEEKIQEIRTAWETNPRFLDHFRFDLTLGKHYFGTHGNCVVICYTYGPDVDTDGADTLVVAGVTLELGFVAGFWAYCDGEFTSWNDAYDKGWLTQENIISVGELLKSQYPGYVEVIINE